MMRYLGCRAQVTKLSRCDSKIRWRIGQDDLPHFGTENPSEQGISKT